jgi:cell division protein FtsA
MIMASDVLIDGLKPQGDVIFALDIGTRTVVGLLGRRDEDDFVLTHAVSVPHNKRSMSDGQIEDIRQVAKVVGKVKDQLEAQSGLKLERVCIAAAGRALKTKKMKQDFDISDREIVTHDLIKSMELETVQTAQEALDSEAGQSLLFFCVGHSVVNYFLDDYRIVSLEGHKGRTATVELIATFLPGVVVDGLYAVIDMCGLQVDSLTLEPIAAMNIIVPPEIRLINIALADIGAGTSDIAVSKDGSIVAYAMATIAGDEITEAIIRDFFVDFQQAEQMKYQSTAGTDEITYRDIFGIEQTVSVSDFNGRIEPSVEVLANTICENIVAVNGDHSPAAVFLVGGGSLITGLPGKVADKLKLDKSRVAIGGQRTFRHVDTTGIKGIEMGAEHVTPLGIAVTSFQNRGYDFSTVIVNGKQVRVFDTRTLTVFDLLNTQGYKAADIMGRAGRTLSYMVNGRRKLIKGEPFLPAEILINGKPASLSDRVTQGDHVIFNMAKAGANAQITLDELLKPYEKTALFEGKIWHIYPTARVNGNVCAGDYSVMNGDEIVFGEQVILSDFARVCGRSGVTFTVDGVTADENTPIKDHAVIYAQAAQKANEALPEHAKSGLPITVTFDGALITLQPNADGMPHTFLELMADMDISERHGIYHIRINGAESGFNTPIKDGDIAEIVWEEPETESAASAAAGGGDA